MDKLTSKDMIDKNALDLRVSAAATKVCPAKVKHVRRIILEDLRQFSARQILELVHRKD